MSVRIGVDIKRRNGGEASRVNLGVSHSRHTPRSGIAWPFSDRQKPCAWLFIEEEYIQ
jgi:hypothetical protein